VRRAWPPFASNALLVGLVALNTRFVAGDHLASALGVQVVLGSAWIVSVRAVARGGWPERVGYVLGGAIGVGAGMLLARWSGA
jgi:hypothetical protein